MKPIFMIFFLLITTQSFANSNDYDFAFCTSCSSFNKENIAKSKLGNSLRKTVVVINKFTRVPYTYDVIKSVDPGMTLVFAQPMPTSQDIKGVIEDAYDYSDLLKNLAYTPILFHDLHFTNQYNFPRTAHDLVGSPNARAQLMNSVSSFLSTQAGSNPNVALGYHIQNLVNNLIGDSELIGLELQIEFNDGSSVVFKVTDVSTDLVSKEPIIKVTQVPNSMMDNENNTLFDDPNMFIGNIYNLGGGGGGGGNIASWVSMINRLSSLGYFRTGTCYWESETQVVCPYQDND